MDDNKVLTLASNERIALTPSMRLLFEISNLRTATPATVKKTDFVMNIKAVTVIPTLAPTGQSCRHIVHQPTRLGLESIRQQLDRNAQSAVGEIESGGII